MVSCTFDSFNCKGEDTINSERCPFFAVLFHCTLFFFTFFISLLILLLQLFDISFSRFLFSFLFFLVYFSSFIIWRELFSFFLLLFLSSIISVFRLSCFLFKFFLLFYLFLSFLHNLAYCFTLIFAFSSLFYFHLLHTYHLSFSFTSSSFFLSLLSFFLFLFFFSIISVLRFFSMSFSLTCVTIFCSHHDTFFFDNLMWITPTATLVAPPTTYSISIKVIVHKLLVNEWLELIEVWSSGSSNQKILIKYPSDINMFKRNKWNRVHTIDFNKIFKGAIICMIKILLSTLSLLIYHINMYVDFTRYASANITDVFAFLFSIKTKKKNYPLWITTSKYFHQYQEYIHKLQVNNVQKCIFILERSKINLRIETLIEI